MGMGVVLRGALVGVLIIILIQGRTRAAILSVGEPDWSISKAEMVQQLYAFEPLQQPLPLPHNNNNNNNNNNHPLQQSPNSQPQPQPPLPPKTAKFSLQDKKLIGPVYQRRGVSGVEDRETIIWPQEQKFPSSTGNETSLRFVVHKEGDEEEIKRAIAQDGEARGLDVGFLEGPQLRIQRHQKVYLPPKKKTVIYILLKEPKIMTDVEVVEPKEEPIPEVFITYQKSDGVVNTKHYTPGEVKTHKYLSQLKSSIHPANTNQSGI